MKFLPTTDLRKLLMYKPVGDSSEVPFKFYKESHIRSMCNTLKSKGYNYTVSVKGRADNALITRLK